MVSVAEQRALISKARADISQQKKAFETARTQTQAFDPRVKLTQMQLRAQTIQSRVQIKEAERLRQIEKQKSLQEIKKGQTEYESIVKPIEKQLTAAEKSIKEYEAASSEAAEWVRAERLVRAGKAGQATGSLYKKTQQLQEMGLKAAEVQVQQAKEQKAFLEEQAKKPEIVMTEEGWAEIEKRIKEGDVILREKFVGRRIATIPPEETAAMIKAQEILKAGMGEVITETEAKHRDLSPAQRRLFTIIPDISPEMTEEERIRIVKFLPKGMPTPSKIALLTATPLEKMRLAEEWTRLRTTFPLYKYVGEKTGLTIEEFAEIAARAGPSFLAPTFLPKKARELFLPITEAERKYRAGVTIGFLKEAKEKPIKIAATAGAFFLLPGALGVIGKAVAPIVKIAPTATRIAGIGVKVGLPALYATSIGQRIIAEPTAEARGIVTGRILAGEVLPMFAGGYAGAKVWPKAIGWWRTRGRKIAIPPEEMIPKEILIGKEPFPMAPRRLHLKEFKKLGFGLHATPQEFKFPTTTRPGVREIPGMYLSTWTSPHFLRVTTPKIRVYGGKLFAPYGKPEVLRVYPKKFRAGYYKTVKPYKLKLTEFGYEKVKPTSKEIRLWKAWKKGPTAFAERYGSESIIFTKEFVRPEIPGVAEVPAMSREIEALIRPTTPLRKIPREILPGMIPKGQKIGFIRLKGREPPILITRDPHLGRKILFKKTTGEWAELKKPYKFPGEFIRIGGVRIPITDIEVAPKIRLQFFKKAPTPKVVKPKFTSAEITKLRTNIPSKYAEFNYYNQLKYGPKSKFPRGHGYPHAKKVSETIQKLMDVHPEYNKYWIKEYGSLKKAKFEMGKAMWHDVMKVSAGTSAGVGPHGEVFYTEWKAGRLPKHLQSIKPKVAEAMKVHGYRRPAVTIEQKFLKTADVLELERYGMKVRKLELPGAREKLAKIKRVKFEYEPPKFTKEMEASRRLFLKDYTIKNQRVRVRDVEIIPKPTPKPKVKTAAEFLKEYEGIPTEYPAVTPGALLFGIRYRRIPARRRITPVSRVTRPVRREPVSYIGEPSRVVPSKISYIGEPSRVVPREPRRIPERPREIPREIRRPPTRIPYVPERPISIIGFPSLLPVKRRVRKKRKIPEEKMGYYAYAKKTKERKWLKLNKIPVTKRRAKDIGSYLTDTSLSATYKIKKTTKPAGQTKLKVPQNYFTRTIKKFRDYKIRKGKKIKLKNKWIEKMRRRLDTKQEVKKIKLARRLSQLKPKKRKKKKPARRKKKSIFF